MKISVIIPVWNCERYILATITSVLNQRYDDFEIIIADGSSTDRTLELVNSIGDPRIRVFSEPDSGQLDAFLKGLSHASGDICYWLNADDIVMPGTFEYVSRIFCECENVELIYSDNFAFEESSRRISLGSEIKFLRDLDHLIFYRQMYSECVFWRRRISVKIPEAHRAFRVYTDYAFFLRLRWERNVYWVPRRLGAFRIHQEQASVKHKRRGTFEFSLIRAQFRREIGLGPAKFRMLQLFWAPSFFFRHKVVPTAKRGVRYVYRWLSGDRDREDIAAIFFDCWLLQSLKTDQVELIGNRSRSMGATSCKKRVI